MHRKVLFESAPWCFLIVIVLLLIRTVELQMMQMSPRVVDTKQTHYQGFLGPGNVPPRPGYMSSFNSSFPFPYNYRGGYGQGHPVVEIFKGIPYASPPIGSLRYESPTPSTLRSNEVYIANKTKGPCPRVFDSTMNRSFLAPDPIRSLKQIQMVAPLEDCLYLDIYAPLNTNKNGPRLPVLVYANSHADEPDDPFDGSSIAAIGHIIVVSFRYRVGVLGFLQPGYSEDVRSISNLGLWDQLAALQWIRENIGAFGGDENNVCLMGFDLDASLAGILALSPLAQAYGGLFHRIILLNGTPFSPVSINPRPLETTVRLARALKCPIHERDGELMSCLRRRPLEQLIGAGQSLGSTILSYPFAPSVDGMLVKPEVAEVNVMDGNIMESIKEVLGRYDLMCGLGEGPVLPSIGQPSWHNIDLDTFVTAAIKIALKLEPGYEPTPALKDDFIRHIKNQYGDPPLMRDIISDYLLINPTINFLNTHSQTGKNTFFFVSKGYDPLHKGKHSEVSYIFSNQIYKWKYVDLGQPNMDLQPFELMIVFIANFVRSGDPNMPNPAERYSSPGKMWPKFRRDPGRFLKFGRDVGVDSKYRRSETNFWTHVFPEILKPYLSALNPDNMEEFNNQWMNNAGSKFPGHFGKNRISPGLPVAETDGTQTLTSMTQNTVVIVGALLLLLNLLCFMGLFYQRERLKKAEVSFRKRYVEAEGQPPEEEQRDTVLTTTELDSMLSEPYGVQGPSHVSQPQPPRRAPLDTMSETETDNGFGPDFLGPNYDPRTKVNRWMQQQQQLNRQQRDTPPVGYPMEVEAEVNARNQDQSPPAYPTVVPLSHTHVQVPPASSQRNSMAEPMPMEFLPPLPYQDPFRPSCPISEIPYADSRATSPSVTNFQVQTPPPAFNNNLSNSNYNYNTRRSMPSPTNSSTASGSQQHLPSIDKRRSRGKIMIPLRNSVIIREMESDDEVEVESSAPKFVPVKTGTLTRSVAVGSNTDTNDDGNGLTVEPSSSALTVHPRPSHHGSGQKVTFADEVL